MTYTLITSLINLCLIFAVWQIHKGFRKYIEQYPWWSYKHPIHVLMGKIEDRVEKFLASKEGKLDQAFIRSKIAEKMADRAFNMASTANLGIVALQKALATPRVLTKHQTTANQLAKNNVDKLFTSNGNLDWLRPLLTDEELEIVDAAEKLKEKMETKQ